MRSTWFAGLAGFALLVATEAAAQEVTLRAVTAFAEGTQFSKNFERFIEKVNSDSKGIIKINYVGGPRAMPPFEVGNAVRTRVVDIANVTGAFYTNLMPESDGFKLLAKPMSEQRKNGTWNYLNELHGQKLNSYYLARQFHNVPFHIYLNKKIDKLDFAGLKVRVTPVYRDVVEAFGGTPITTAPGEVYTALERGVVDGYGWPITGIFDLGWEKVTKFRMEPAFYSVEVNVLVNLDAWKALNPAQRKVLSDAAAWVEALDSENVARDCCRTRASGKGRHSGDRFRPLGIEAVHRAGQRGGVAVGDQAGADERTETATAGGELTAHAVTPKAALGKSNRDPGSAPGHAMIRLSRAFGRLFEGLAAIAALILLTMVTIVTGDIILRNLTRAGLYWANEVSEYALYLITLLARPGCYGTGSMCGSTSW